MLQTFLAENPNLKKIVQKCLSRQGKRGNFVTERKPWSACKASSVHVYTIIQCNARPSIY
jgi:hypothetical protein